MENCTGKRFLSPDCWRTAGWKVLNDVVYNQVLVCDADDAATEKLLRTVQERGVCWLEGSRWAAGR